MDVKPISEIANTGDSAWMAPISMPDDLLDDMGDQSMGNLGMDEDDNDMGMSMGGGGGGGYGNETNDGEFRASFLDSRFCLTH